MAWTLPERIETERLVLRPLREVDWPAFARFMADPQATEHLAFAADQCTPDGARGLFDFVCHSQTSSEPQFVLTVVARDGEEYLGSCGLAPLADSTAECFYTLMPEQWGQGYATEAARAMLAYAFDVLGLEAVEANVSDANPPSRRVAEKLGMRLAGPSAPAEHRAAGSRLVIERSRS